VIDDILVNALLRILLQLLSRVDSYLIDVGLSPGRPTISPPDGGRHLMLSALTKIQSSLSGGMNDLRAWE